MVDARIHRVTLNTQRVSTITVSRRTSFDTSTYRLTKSRTVYIGIRAERVRPRRRVSKVRRIPRRLQRVRASTIGRHTHRRIGVRRRSRRRITKHRSVSRGRPRRRRRRRARIRARDVGHVRLDVDRRYHRARDTGSASLPGIFVFENPPFLFRARACRDCVDPDAVAARASAGYGRRSASRAPLFHTIHRERLLRETSRASADITTTTES